MSHLRLSRINVLLWPTLLLLALFGIHCGTANDQSLSLSSGVPEFGHGVKVKEIITSPTLPHPGFTFAVMGDSRDDRLTYTEIETTLMHSIPTPGFMVFTGDMITDGGSGIEWFQWEEDSKIITDHIPIYPVVGNHDVQDPGTQLTYQAQFGPPGNQLYYAFWQDHCLFIVLDGCIPGQKEQITGDQITWLQQTLAQDSPPAEHIFVFVHQPLFPVAEHKTDSLKPETVAILHPLFVSYKVDAVFAGHEHIYWHQIRDGVTYITTGGAGAPLASHAGNFYHFVYVAVAGTQVYGWTFDVEGHLRDSWTFTR